jgi:aminopeptidase-like protein
MKAQDLISQWTEDADDLLHRLFPICRSITGDGLRQTLQLLSGYTPFDLHEIPSGTHCYDWTIPDEWNVRDAFIEDSSGRRVVDFGVSNIHLVNYSMPVDARMPFNELASHLHTLPAMPDAIPYRTSYYKRSWGFCLSQEQFNKLDQNDTYHVVVDTFLKPGALTYGDTVLKGLSGQEYLITTYCCHPSLANDNLSGVVLWALLLKELRHRSLRHSYRFVIAPETIGALAYISQNEAQVRNLAGGLVVTTVAGPGKFGYKHTWRGDHLIDRVVVQTFRELELDYIDYPFDISGSDERQYSTPGLRVPLGTISKDKYYEYPFYHTSLDNLDFAKAGNLIQTLQLYLLAIEKLEQNVTYRSLNSIGEPMLGKRGLYPTLGGAIRQQAASNAVVDTAREVTDENNFSVIYGNELDAILWLLFYLDGKTPLLDIAEKTSLPVQQLFEVAQKLVGHGLLEEAIA